MEMERGHGRPRRGDETPRYIAGYPLGDAP